MGFFTFVAMILIIWLLWTLCRNTGDALDKQTALQYEIVALEKRIEQLVERLPAGSATGSTENAAAPVNPVRDVAAPARNTVGKTKAKSAVKASGKKTSGTSASAKPRPKADNDSAGSPVGKDSGPSSGT